MKFGQISFSRFDTFNSKIQTLVEVTLIEESTAHISNTNIMWIQGISNGGN